MEWYHGTTEQPTQEHEVRHLGKAKVAQLDEALEVYEDVLGLEVAVDNVVVVQILQGQHYAADVELGQVFVHALQHLHLHPKCKALHATPHAILCASLRASLCVILLAILHAICDVVSCMQWFMLNTTKC